MPHETKDLKLNSGLEVFIDSTGDLASVGGREHFEQLVGIRLLLVYEQLVGLRDPEEIEAKLVVEAQELARSMSQLERITSISVNEVIDEPNTFNVEITYETEETFEETLQ